MRPGAADADLPFARTRCGVRLAVKLTPKSARQGITGIERDAAGELWLRVKVRAVPEGGKANAALIRLLAKTWRLPASSITIASGAASRGKRLDLAGAAADLAATLSRWMREDHV
jgi:uncharacterized protein YggU (UPF0235/DUF167 family)